MKNVLILGSGMIATPVAKYILEYEFKITIASNTIEKAESIINNNKYGKAVFLDANNEKDLEKLISTHDIVVCLLPHNFYKQVANLCIKHKINMVTTLPLDNDVAELNKQAKEAGVIILNECGFSPGIDHMSAMRVINTIHGFGGKVLEFYSICGALPATEVSNDNPFKYKFSWSPQSVLELVNTDAEYLKNNKKIKVNSKNMLKHVFDMDFPAIGKLEVFPNKTSIPYIELYKIPEVQTMYRGTFRYKNWSEIINALQKIGFTQTNEYELENKTFAELTAILIKTENNEQLKKHVAKYLKISEQSVAIQGMEFLGLFDNKKTKHKKISPYQVVLDLMIDKMMFAPDERDMCVMKHVFLAEYPDGKKEVVRSRLLDFGLPKQFTSIARTVAFPVASAVRMILENEIEVKGVHIPLIPEIYNPILSDLENLNLELVEEFGLPISQNICLP